MAVERILIAVKTYPSLSRSYDELVCTAGFHENGEWIRIYPIPFRKLDFDKRYPKYTWIEVDIEKNQSDPRPESHRIKDYTKIKIVGEIPADGKSWDDRRKYVLKNIHTNLKELIDEANNKNTISLATFKPSRILNFSYCEVKNREWNKDKLDSINARAHQMDLFGGEESPFQVVDKLPYKFYYQFEDEEGTQSCRPLITAGANGRLGDSSRNGLCSEVEVDDK